MDAIRKYKRWETKNELEVIRILSGRSKVFLVSNGKTSLLVDTSAPRLWNKLESELDNLGLTVDLLILTHPHFDHAGNAHRVKEKYRPLVIAHKEETLKLASGTGGIPAGTNFITRSLVNLVSRRKSELGTFASCPVDVVVQSKLDLVPYGLKAYCIHTPGHTAGSMSVIVDNEIALVGDAMFGIFPGSVFPPFADDVPALIKSWGILLDTGCSLFLPAHGSACSKELLLRRYNRRM